CLVDRPRPADDPAPLHAGEVDVAEAPLHDPHRGHPLAEALGGALVEVAGAAGVAVAVLEPLAVDVPVGHGASRAVGLERGSLRAAPPAGKPRHRRARVTGTDEVLLRIVHTGPLEPHADEPPRPPQLSRFSRPSACWFQGTRCVSPAAPIVSRCARYQS